MDYVNLGRSGLKVSRICLGCMTFGVPERGDHAWTLDEESSRPIIRHPGPRRPRGNHADIGDRQMWHP